MRTVNVFRTSEMIFRWQAETYDSKGRKAVGIGITKRGAIRDLKSRIDNRESFYAGRWDKRVGDATNIEVGW